MMIACFMCGPPQFYDGCTVLLLLLYSGLALWLSNATHVASSRSKDRVALLLPPATLLCWFLFQRELMLATPITGHFYRSLWGQTAWRLNSAICIAFGMVFAIRILRSPSRRRRVYGMLMLLPFAGLLIGFNALKPVGRTEGLLYRLDAWLRPPASEPSHGGQPLSYWVRRVDDLADISEPAREAIRTMGNVGVEALIRQFRTGEGGWSLGEERPHPWEVRRRAAEALKSLGPDASPAVPVMVESLTSPDRNTREQAAGVLAAAGDTSSGVIVPLIHMLQDEDTAYHAMLALAELAAKDHSIVPQLAATAKGTPAKAAYWAMVALAEIGPASQTVLPDLIACVQREPSQMRQPAVQAIALIGTNAAPAVPALVAALKDSDEWTRKCIYIALGRIGPSVREAVPVLQSALTNETYLPSRMDIARALWRADSSQKELVLATIQVSFDEGLLQLRNERRLGSDFLSALDLFGEMGPAAAPYASKLEQLLASNQPDIQFHAAWALGRIAPDKLPVVKNCLSHLMGLEHYPLEQIGSNDWGRALSELKQKRESYHLRIAALGALWQLDETARPALGAGLVDLLRDWGYFTSMKGCEPAEQAAIPALRAILSEPAYSKAHTFVNQALRDLEGNGAERW